MQILGPQQLQEIYSKEPEGSFFIEKGGEKNDGGYKSWKA